MIEIESLPCPSCGSKVATLGGPMKGSADPGTGQFKSDSTKHRACPTCQSKLKRDAVPGAEWQLDSET